MPLLLSAGGKEKIARTLKRENRVPASIQVYCRTFNPPLVAALM